jgi:hypothetical protein
MADEPNTDINLVDDHDKDMIWNGRRKMAWLALWGIILPTIFIILRIHDATIIEKISDLMTWYYVGLTSIVGAYFGFTTWSTIKGKGG